MQGENYEKQFKEQKIHPRREGYAHHSPAHQRGELGGVWLELPRRRVLLSEGTQILFRAKIKKQLGNNGDFCSFRH